MCLSDATVLSMAVKDLSARGKRDGRQAGTHNNLRTPHEKQRPLSGQPTVVGNSALTPRPDNPPSGPCPKWTHNEWTFRL